MTSQLNPPTIAELTERLPALMARDEHRLGRRLHGARKARDAAARDALLTELAPEVEAAEGRVARRQAAIPRPSYPAALPVSARKDDILAAIRDHQVTIVAGETGSGKSTQLPKICLELGRGVRGLVGHTQPRRIAARAVAERVAEELGTTVGGLVGYSVRFTDKVGDDTLVKVMTDGILLAEIQRDRLLTRYDTIIVDEAHERSLNIDFLLGYLKSLLPRRPDLKLIVTSATIDTERFASHFDGAPVVDVSGRAHPVELRYRPLDEDDAPTGAPARNGRDSRDGRDQAQAICDAVEELRREGPGDVLVFLSGEREIRDTADALRALHLRDTEILPLYARLSAAEQHRVFASHPGRRVVLATNVAETSLTVPGILYVVDPGTARVSRYSRRTKVQRLPIEAVSQASASQRAGRCGRVAPGVCIRLYSEEDYRSRPEFTEPEILRTNLASVILQMAALGLGDIASFPFVDPPDARNIKDGVALLEELGALDPAHEGTKRWLTPLGRDLAQLPLDPRLARMVLEADRNGCVREVMVIAAALSIQDPRERPAGDQQAAAEHHARFQDEDSDFMSYLELWEYLQDQQRQRGSNQFRRRCKAEHINFLRVREWQDVYSQLRQVATTLGIRLNGEPGDRDGVHRSLLAGLLSHLGLKDTSGASGAEGARGGRGRAEYLGARNARFAIAPGSALARTGARWVMAAELVETNRLWGRVAARAQPEWAEQLGAHLVRRSYGEPYWDARRGAAMALERVTLYGLPLVTGRRVPLGRVDPALARELFIRHALVTGDWHAHHRFVEHNRQLVDEVRELEHRARRGGILAGDEALFAFFDARVGAEVTSSRHFDQWWKQARRQRPDLLDFTLDLLVDRDAGDFDAEAFPDVWHHGDLALALSYAFEPGTAQDGVTVHVPLAVLNQLGAETFDWQVPGLREELVIALVRTLPKPLRRHVVPAPEYARAVLDRVGPEDGPLHETLARELSRLGGVAIPADSFDVARAPDHLRATFQVEGHEGLPVAVGKDLATLKDQLRGHVRAAISQAAHGLERTGLRAWEGGEIPRVVEVAEGGHALRAYPALVDEGDSVALRLLPTEGEQRAAMAAGTRRLLLLTVPSPSRAVQNRLKKPTRAALARLPQAAAAALLEDAVAVAVDELVARGGGPAWAPEDFAALQAEVRAGLVDAALGASEAIGRVLTSLRSVEAGLDAVTAPALQPAVVDMRAQLDRLVHPGFVRAAGAPRLGDVARYLEAMEHRLGRLAADARRDLERTRQVQRLEAEYSQLAASLPAPAPGLEQVRWMLEELRVSYFAQSLGTAQPISEARVRRAMSELSHVE
ncbi:MAG: ATP-dependent RNA helicase HrpA [Acidimicrobiia bacterium]|nr:ATP-dependent RNA helicase HrpA [Acidimicrobiia bacterium]